MVVIGDHRETLRPSGGFPHLRFVLDSFVKSVCLYCEVCGNRELFCGEAVRSVQFHFHLQAFARQFEPQAFHEIFWILFAVRLTGHQLRVGSYRGSMCPKKFSKIALFP